MAKLNEIRFFLLVSLMILPTRALKVYLANAEGNCLEADLRNGVITYAPGSYVKYTIKIQTRNVILYIVSRKRFSDIMRTELRDKRMKIGEKLSKDVKYELFYMAIKGFQKSVDEPIIRNFIRATIVPSDSLSFDSKRFKTIGKINLSHFNLFEKYEETPKVFVNKLEDHLELLN